MRRFTSGAEALGARFLVHVEQVGVPARTMPVAHTVEAAQVRARLGRRDDVVHRDRQLRARQAHVDQRRAEALELGERTAHGAVHVGGERRRKELARQPDAQSGERPGRRRPVARLRQRSVKVLRSTLGAGRVARIEAAHRRQQQRAVLGAAREWTGLIEARRKSDHPVARAGAVGRLDPGDAGEAGRLADRAAGVGAGGCRDQARGHRCGRAAGRATRHALRIPRVAHRRDRRVLVRRAHRELVAIQLAERHHAGVGEAGHDGRVERAEIAGEHL